MVGLEEDFFVRSEGCGFQLVFANFLGRESGISWKTEKDMDLNHHFQKMMVKMGI